MMMPIGGNIFFRNSVNYTAQTKLMEKFWLSTEHKIFILFYSYILCSNMTIIYTVITQVNLNHYTPSGNYSNAFGVLHVWYPLFFFNKIMTKDS